MAFGMMNAFAQTIIVDDMTIKAGETKEVSINLNNTQTNIVSFQMDLTLPDGITINKAGCGLSNRFTDSDQELTIGKQPNGDYRLTSTSLALKPISGTSGEIIKLSLTASASAKGGTATIRNIVLATSNSETLKPANTFFKANVTYTLTYKVDGTVYKTFDVVYGTTITPESAPTKEGHTFTGWSEIPATMPNHDVEVTGTFSINSYTLTYKVDGVEYKKSTVVYGTAITPEPAPTKEGHTFSGWSEIPATMPAHDVEVTGTFTVNNYTLTYIVDGEVYKTLKVDFGTAITPEPAPTKEGHTFSGWSEIPATMPNHDVVVTGTFSINSYKLTYMLNGEVYLSESVVYGTTLVPEPALTKEGYTFSGWSEIPATMPAHDVTVRGTLTVNSYTLTYKVDGEVYKTETINYGTAIVPEPTPTKEGHTFSGWSEIPATMPAHDVEVIGTFSINSYTLTYLLNGEEYKKENVVYGTPLTPEPDLQKEGYTFSGWSEVPATMPAHDVTVRGTLTINSYALTYLLNGEVYKRETIVYGTPLIPEPALQKEGYTFSGWSEIPATMPAHDVTVRGMLTVNSYTLTYKVDGEVYKTLTVVFGTAITPEPAPTKEGHTFSGWSEIPATMPAYDVDVTGTFSINNYTLTYLLDGEVYKKETVVYGTPLTQEPDLQKEGYTFSGWSEIPATMPAHDVTVRGTFTVNSYTLTYKVDGEVYKTSIVAYGTAIIPEAQPSKVGYTFSGWSEIPATMPAHNVEVNGTFSINSYTLTYMVDGEVYKTERIVYGTTIVPEPALTKEGYTFSGWSPIPEKMPARDVIVTGTFSINSYTLTYKVDGEVFKTYTVVYGTAITPEAELTKEGYTFSGWSEIPATMPAHDVIVTGTFTVNSYTLTYKVDGKVYKSLMVDYGTAITPEPALTKEGYTFSGWSEIPAIMPAHDVTVTGTFTINEYTLTYILDGEVYKTFTIVYGTPIIPEARPIKVGYTFSGWSEIPETMPAKDVVVTGSFTINSYKLTYIVDGAVYKSYTLYYGTTITPEAEPTKEGYTFSGWSEIPETMPARDVEVIGTFTINQYLLTYVLDGEEYKSFKVDYNAVITPISAPVKKGMTFSGWEGIPETMPAHDVTATGIYSWSEETFDYVIYQVTDTLNNYASVIGYEKTDGDAEILSYVEIGRDTYVVNSIEDDAFAGCTGLTSVTIPDCVTNISGDALPQTTTIYTSVGKALLVLWNEGYDNILETGSGRELAAPEVSLAAATASSLRMSYTNEYPTLRETVVMSDTPIEKGENGYEMVLRGLEPGKLYNEIAFLTLTLEDISYTKSSSFRTEPLALATQQPKVVSLGNVIVAAESNLDDDEQNVGFEWRRIDWTDDFASGTGAAYLYEGTMEGYIHNLNTEKLWKYRPYYESNSGTRYYGEWVGIDPTNTSYFEPTVHTYSSITVTGNSVEVKGYAMQGTDNVTSQGFAYWTTDNASSRRRVNGIPADATIVLVNGYVMTATLEGLEYDTEYCCVAFVTTSDGETFYGEPQIFKTNADPDAIEDVKVEEEAMEIARYDINGRKLAVPQKGINIIRYSDGTSRKVLVK